MGMQFIQTGVDKLVALIKERGRISFKEAAKILGVSTSVIEEWADFLEQEGLIETEYRFTTLYMIDKKLSPKEIEEKSKEFKNKKDVFVEKAEMTLNSLESEAKDLGKVKDEFEKFKSELGFDLGHVQEEIEELERLEKLKKQINGRVDLQKNNSSLKFKNMEKEIAEEQRKYKLLMEMIEREEGVLKKERTEAISIEDSEKLLKKRLDDLKKTIKEIDKRLQTKGKVAKGEEVYITKLNDMADRIKNDLESEKATLNELIDKSETHDDKITDIQKRIIGKIAKKEESLKNAKKISDKFKQFFEKKANTEKFLNEVNKDRDDLQKELKELLAKAKSFKISTKSKEVDDHIAELETKFDEVDRKKEKFEKETKNLVSLLKK